VDAGVRVIIAVRPTAFPTDTSGLTARESIPVTRELAEHWTDLLLAVLNDGMIDSFTERPATRERSSGGYACLMTAPRSSMPHDPGTDDDATADFLTALALAALDPGSTFGTEVDHGATGAGVPVALHDVGATGR
jgi:hypothetical protein